MDNRSSIEPSGGWFSDTVRAMGSFPPVFWVANTIEVLERFSYYGIYFSFGIYMSSLGYSRDQLGYTQTIFLLFSYMIPVISGTFADRYGFKKVLIVSYLAYLPSILLLIYTKTYSGIVLTMLAIGLAAGIFKPLISGTVRAVSSKDNKTLGFGIFYAMVNVGGSLGPIVAGKLRAISWDYAFMAAGAAIGLMLLITIFFYKEPERERESISLGKRLRDIVVVLSDVKFSFFLLLLGVFFWIPFWGFFNLCALYVDTNIDTAKLYQFLDGTLGAVPLIGSWLVSFISRQDEQGVYRVLGESVSHTGYIIMVMQIFISGVAAKYRAMPTFMFGCFIAALGLGVLGLAFSGSVSLVFLGIFLFAVGEMVASPRIQEYVTWMAPKEKAGLYMGANFLALGIGAFSGAIYTPLYGWFEEQGNPDYVWYVLAANLIVGMLVLTVFTKLLGEFEELEA